MKNDLQTGLDKIYKQKTITHIGTIDPNYAGGKPRIALPINKGELSGKTFRGLKSYIPTAGEEVLVLEIGDTFLIVGATTDWADVIIE